MTETENKFYSAAWNAFLNIQKYTEIGEKDFSMHLGRNRRRVPLLTVYGNGARF